MRTGVYTGVGLPGGVSSGMRLRPDDATFAVASGDVRGHDACVTGLKIRVSAVRFCPWPLKRDNDLGPIGVLGCGGDSRVNSRVPFAIGDRPGFRGRQSPALGRSERVAAYITCCRPPWRAGA